MWYTRPAPSHTHLSSATVRRRPMTEANNQEQPRGSSGVAIAAIIVTGIVILACIIAFSAIAIAFLRNAPW